MSVLLFNDGPDCILHVCKLGSWQCVGGGGGSVLGLQPSSLDKKITL